MHITSSGTLVSEVLETPLSCTKLAVFQMEGVSAVNNLHIWQLEGHCIIATAHIQCHDPGEYMTIARNIKTLFHDHGIHSTTVQPEFVEVSADYICDTIVLILCLFSVPLSFTFQNFKRN